MSPLQYQQALRARGFFEESGGRWHGVFGITIPNTWNSINDTSLADRARDEIIKQLDAEIANKRRNYNAK
jgi:hypothetical protein